MGEPGFLFGPAVPDGFHYRADFVTAAEELELAAALERISFSDFEMRGVIAKRRVAFFGRSYGHEVVPPIPEFLLPLRAAVAAWAGIEPGAFVMALVNEVPPRVAHRLASGRAAIRSGGGSVAALVLPDEISPLRRGRTRSGGGPRRATHEIVLEPRSAYLMTGAARASVRAPRATRRGAPVLDHVPHAAVRSARASGAGPAGNTGPAATSPAPRE